MTETEKKSNNVGAIWEKKTKAGDDMLSIKVEIEGKTYNLTALQNSYKEDGDKRPNWNILPMREMSNQPAQQTQQTNNDSSNDDDVSDDIPF